MLALAAVDVSKRTVFLSVTDGSFGQPVGWREGWSCPQCRCPPCKEEGCSAPTATEESAWDAWDRSALLLSRGEGKNHPLANCCAGRGARAQTGEEIIARPACQACTCVWLNLRAATIKQSSTNERCGVVPTLLLRCSVLLLRLHFAQAPAYFMPNLCCCRAGSAWILSLLTALAGNGQVAVGSRIPRLAAPGLGTDAWTGKEGSPSPS